TPVSEAEKHDRWLIHAASHIDTWERLQREGVAPADVDYDAVPRGRAAYDWVREKFMGHSDIRTTQKYLHLVESADAAKIMDTHNRAKLSLVKSA
ncbi:MAG TPA: hypothetical protein VGL00_01025, partial [Terracidiphilus sp.]